MFEHGVGGERIAAGNGAAIGHERHDDPHVDAPAASGREFVEHGVVREVGILDVDVSPRIAYGLPLRPEYLVVVGSREQDPDRIAGFVGIIGLRSESHEQVVEVAFDGIQASTRYPGGMALRFARVKGYREDKNAEEADTIDAVRSVFDGA